MELSIQLIIIYKRGVRLYGTRVLLYSLVAQPKVSSETHLDLIGEPSFLQLQVEKTTIAPALYVILYASAMSSVLSKVIDFFRSFLSDIPEQPNHNSKTTGLYAESKAESSGTESKAAEPNAEAETQERNLESTAKKQNLAEALEPSGDIFEYQTLKSNEFRLLRLLPGENLAAELEHADIDQAPRYVALSYTWDKDRCRTPAATYLIFINGKKHLIRENLYDALTHVAESVRQGNCLLWADAICINQNDLEERNSQIQHMKQLFENAHRVYGWLGLPHDEEEISLGVKLLKKLRSLYDEQRALGNDLNLAILNITQKHPNIVPRPESVWYKGWLGIIYLFRRPYWGRIWIHQEATGPAQTTYRCGRYEFSRAEFDIGVDMRWHFRRSTVVDPDIFRGTNHSSGLSRFRTRNGDFGTRGANLLTIISNARNAKATDPRDNVYALLALADDVLLGAMIPDYTKSVQEVYADVVHFTLAKPNHRLEIFGQVSEPCDEAGGSKEIHEGQRLPSWVPDFQQGCKPFEVTKQVTREKNPDSDDLVEVRRDAYSPDGYSRRQTPEIEGTTMKLDGFMLDIIFNVSSIAKEGRGNLPVVARSWTLPNSDRIYSPTSQTIDVAFRTTLVMDIMDTGLDSVRGYALDWDVLGANDDTLSFEKIIGKHDMIRSMYRACLLRKFSRTLNNYMGLVPPTTRIGDKVCVLYEGKALYVLRDVGEGCHQLIGECYIHGFMDGQAVELLKNGTLQEERFVLI